MKFYLVLKKKEILSYVTKRMNPEEIMLSEKKPVLQGKICQRSFKAVFLESEFAFTYESKVF